MINISFMPELYHVLLICQVSRRVAVIAGE